jgi:rubrerythrin
MDLSKYTLEDILLAAIKSEMESNSIYSTLAHKVKNGLLKDKLLFLAKEEQKHKEFIERLYAAKFPKKKLYIPATTPVPLPSFSIPDEDTPLGILLQHAMKAEQAAYDFYTSLSTVFANEEKIHNILSYFADMELQHYKILEIEKENMDRFEEADVYWDMVHVGP